MTRTFSWLALFALLTGVGIIGCGEEDYTDLDNEYSTLDENLRVRYDEATKGYDEMNNDFTTVTVADDWDDARRTSYETAKARLSEYNTRLQEGTTQMDKWKADLEAAKQEGREAYQAKLNEAQAWYDSYNLWLDTFNQDLTRYRQINTSGSTDPWWFTMYAVDTATAAGTDLDVDIDSDGDGVMDEEADGIEDDKEAVKDAAKDAAGTIKEGVRDVIGDSDDD